MKRLLLTRDDLPEIETRYAHVMAAVDLTSESNDVVETALRIQQRFDAQLSVMVAIPPVARGFSAADIADGAEVSTFEADVRAQHDNTLNELLRRFDIDAASAVIRTGTPAQEIHAAAEELGADLIVLGAPTWVWVPVVGGPATVVALAWVLEGFAFSHRGVPGLPGYA